MFVVECVYTTLSLRGYLQRMLLLSYGSVWGKHSMNASSFLQQLTPPVRASTVHLVVCGVAKILITWVDCNT